MYRMLRNLRGLAVLVCALGLSGAPVNADVPDVVFEITAEAGPLTATLEVLSEWGTYNPETQTWSWVMPEPFLFVDGGVFAVLNELDVSVVDDPQVNLSFAVQADALPTTFHLGSALIAFDPISNAEGQASAAITLTDIDGTGATLTGIGATGGAYLAQYNGWAGDPINGPQGTTFAEGIPSVIAPAWLTETETLNVDATPIPVDVYDMSSLFSFELSAWDQASGTSAYEIIPEPAGLVALALGGLALLRRRR